MTDAARLAILISIFAIAVRFVSINQPYIDKWSWRQSDVAAIARNYFEGGYRFSRPQIDWAGDQAGYVGTEFPILPFVAALSYKIFGVHEWVGRIQGVILFALSLPFFFFLVRKSFGEIAAIWALLFYSFAPLGLMASRCFMPDMPSLALSIIGLYFFERCLEREDAISFFVSALCISMSILIKVTSVVIAAPLLCLSFHRFGIVTFRRSRMWLFALIAIIPTAFWYWHAYRISEQFYPHHFFGAGGVRVMSATWYLKIARLLVTSTFTPVLFALGVVGLFLKTRASIFHWWLAAMIVFIIVVGYGNRHEWYQLPLVPIFAAFAGASCARVMAFEALARANSVAALFMRAGFSLALIAFAAFTFAYTKIFYRPSAGPLRDAGLTLNQISAPNSLIVAADNGDPTLLYYAHRKGWHFLEKDGIYDGEPADSTQAIVDLEGLRKRGASYLVLTSNTAWWLDYYADFGARVATTAKVADVTPEFKICQFDPTSK